MLHYLPDSACAYDNLAKAARQLGKMIEHPNQSKHNPCARADETPRTFSAAQANSHPTCLFYRILGLAVPDDVIFSPYRRHNII